MAGRRKWAAKLDIYRKVPDDLFEGSKQGNIISWVAILTILILFYKETSDYLTTRIVPDLMLDSGAQRQGGKRFRHDNSDDMIRVDFNITMMDLKCDYVEVDVVSVLGNNQNMTKYVKKLPIDADGVLNHFAARNVQQNDVRLALSDEMVEQTLEELHESGEAAVSLDEASLEFALNENFFVFVDFFASWCSHCQALAPTWEVFAKIMNDATNEVNPEDTEDGYKKNELREAEQLDASVLIAKVDCVKHHTLCQANSIMAYPTLRLFVKGKAFQNYRGHRMVTDFIQFLNYAETYLGEKGVLDMSEINEAVGKHMDVTLEDRHWAEALERARHHHHKPEWNPDLHPGCQISGSIVVGRVPGNFYIQAYSPHHDLSPAMTNLSHEIHHLEFSPGRDSQRITGRDVLPKDITLSRHPMDGNVYVTRNLHEAYHHYVKLITTNDRFFQVLQSTQLASYEAEEVPEAKFIIDLSPIAVRYKKESRHWYDYFTSVMAIVGGTFTVVGFLNAGIHRVATAKKRLSTKARQPAKQPYR